MTSEKTFIQLKDEALKVIQSVYDPEIPVNIYELGLIYELNVSPDNEVYVRMTVTSPSCPVADSLPREVEEKLRAIEGVKDVKVEMTFDPPWDQTRMSEAAKLELGFM